MCVIMRKYLAFAVFIIIIGVLFQSPVAKAQEDSAHSFDAEFQAQTLPDGSPVIENNLAEQGEIRTEIDIWENDMGKEVTDGSYVGGIFESSLMEVDYEPLKINDSYSYDVKLYDNLLPSFYRDDYGTPLFPPPPIPLVAIGDEYGGRYQDNFPIAKKRSIITISNVMNFTNRMIMSGATEFYVKIPLNPSCINFDEITPTMCAFKIENENSTQIYQSINNGHLYLEPNFSIIYDPFPFRWQSYDNGTVYDVQQDSGLIRQDINVGEILFPYYRGNIPNIIQPIRNKNIVNDGLYARVLGTIEPNTNYLFTFNCILESQPLVYLTEDDICSNGRNSSIMVSDLNFVLEPSGSTWWDGTFEITASHGWHQLVKVNVNETNFPLINETIDVPVDIAFSFIFKSGRGNYGMFGHKFHFNKNDALVFYDRLEAPTTDKFVSVMLPFIADSGIFINLTVWLLDPTNKYEPTGVLSEYGNEYVYVNTNVWHSNEQIDYTDYIIFTVPYRINATTVRTDYIDIKVMVTFEKEADVTFMFSTPDNAKTGIDDSYIEQNPSLWDSTTEYDTFQSYIPYYKPRRNLTYIYEDVRTIQFGHYTWYDYEGFIKKVFPTQNVSSSKIKVPRDYSDATIMHYELFRSVQLTDGIWHELVTSAEGFQYATHFFERRISIGLINLWVDTTDNDTEEQVAWYDDGLQKWGKAWESLTKLDIINAIYYAVSGTISLIWNGLQAFLGFIVGIFYKVWDGLVKVGKFVYSVLSSFVGKILEIVGDIVNSLENILEVMLYIIAIIIFAYVVSWSGRFIYKKISLRGLGI